MCADFGGALRLHRGARVSSILAKFGVPDRTRALLKALEARML